LDFGDIKKPYPLIKVKVEATGETVYVIRPWAKRIRPKVFAAGKYKVVIGGKHQVFENLEATPTINARTIPVSLE